MTEMEKQKTQKEENPVFVKLDVFLYGIAAEAARDHEFHAALRHSFGKELTLGRMDESGLPYAMMRSSQQGLSAGMKAVNSDEQSRYRPHSRASRRKRVRRPHTASSSSSISATTESFTASSSPSSAS